jgi:outer membrane protein assembly factor BamB
MIGTSDGIVAEMAPGQVSLLDPKKGQKIWTYSGDVPVSAPLLLNRDHIYAAFSDGAVVRLDRRTGSVSWKATVPSLVSRAMTVSGGKLYFVTGAQELGALDVQSGKQDWIVDTSKSVGVQIRSNAAPLIDEGLVIIGTSGGRLEGFDGKTGIRAFSTSLGSVEGRFSDIIANPMILGQLIIVARYDGLVAAFDRRSPDKAPIWKVRGAPITEARTFAGGVYMTTANGELTSINPKDGTSIWKTKVGDSLSVLELRETSVLVAGPTGVVAQVDRQSGEVQWQELLDSKIIQLPIYFDDAVWFSTGLGNLYGYFIR